MPSKELTITEQSMPATFEELSGMAKALVASGFFTDVKSISQGIVKVQAGKELGIPPIFAMQNITMIKGRLCTSANTMALLIKRSGRYNYRITEHTDLICKITFKEFENNTWVDVGDSMFTMEDAKRAKLVYPDSAWTKYPRAMLFSRAISQGARLYTPDAIGGVYTSEEIKSSGGPLDDEPEPVTVAEEPQVTEHWCEEHSTKFFKSANMNSYGHPIEGEINEKGKQMWCHEHTTKPQTAKAPTGLPIVTEEPPEPDNAQAEQDADELRPDKPQPTAEVTAQAAAHPPAAPVDEDWEKMGRDKAPTANIDTPTTLAGMLGILQKHDRKYGPSWFYKQFSGYTPASMKDPAIVAQAYAEVKEIMGW